MSQLEIIKQWHFRNHRVQLAHYESARRLQRRHLMLGVPAIMLSTIVGASVFATLSKQTDQQVFDVLGLFTIGAPHLRLVLGFLSVTAAVLTGLQTFLKLSELAEKHRLAGARFANLKHRIEMLASFPPPTDAETKATLENIEAAWSKLREDSPTLPAPVWRYFERTLSLDQHKCL